MSAAKQPRTRSTRAERLPATGDATRDAPHVSRAVRGCSCMSCEEHRVLAHRDAALARLVARDADEPMTGEVIMAPNASAEFVAALGGVHGLYR